MVVRILHCMWVLVSYQIVFQREIIRFMLRGYYPLVICIFIDISNIVTVRSAENMSTQFM